MKELNPKVVVLVAVLAIAAAGAWLVFNQTRPAQTVTDFHKVPPKGAGLKDRN